MSATAWSPVSSTLSSAGPQPTFTLGRRTERRRERERRGSKRDEQRGIRWDEYHLSDNTVLWIHRCESYSGIIKPYITLGTVLYSLGVSKSHTYTPQWGHWKGFSVTKEILTLSWTDKLYLDFLERTREKWDRTPMRNTNWQRSLNHSSVCPLVSPQWGSHLKLPNWIFFVHVFFVC